jgi:hypothetical protein
MTPEKSLYDLAARVFAANHVMLREHCCVPPIIGTRIASFTKERFKPLHSGRGSSASIHLVDIYVETGCAVLQHECARADVIATRSRAVGRPAVRRSNLASCRCSAWSRRRASTSVRRRFSAAVLRRASSATTRGLSGSERDIMFISVVVDPNDCKALAGNMFEQRFNVAAAVHATACISSGP